MAMIELGKELLAFPTLDLGVAKKFGLAQARSGPTQARGLRPGRHP